ncbi:hypothetical protein FRB94_003414 [Tulasnella sp. JGI-2019a]|nr:hypothetical protein FRB93_012041 [Tulasnella sp. JGI-2019a]KAG9003051.1 hypothetical protein FRB94_003414 [Tulasnella sp. JGI-2019a]
MSRRTLSLSPVLISRKRLRPDDSDDDEVIEGPPRAPPEVSAIPPPGSTVSDDPEDQCVICLQSIVDRAILPPCAHDRFCFECLELWAAQSRKCPLCATDIGPYIIHNIRSQYDFQKRHLPPLRTSPLPMLPLTRSVRTRASRNSRQTARAEWGRREEEDQDMLERAIEKRKWVYRHNLYAKHVASNSYTRFKPYPSPTQFGSSPDLIARTTTFIRRELQVWNNLDVEFLTTFILALMKSIDIRAESAVKLLSEFLDMDTPYTETGRKVNAEHFAHELYTYLRSPYRELSTYDSVIQYDAPTLSRSSVSPEGRHRLHDRWVPERTRRSRSRSYFRSHAEPASAIDDDDPLERSPRDVCSPSWDRHGGDVSPVDRRKHSKEYGRIRNDYRPRTHEPGPSHWQSRPRSRTRSREREHLSYHGDRNLGRPTKYQRPHSPSSSSHSPRPDDGKSPLPRDDVERDDSCPSFVHKILDESLDDLCAASSAAEPNTSNPGVGISIKGASKGKAALPSLAITGLSIKGRASRTSGPSKTPPMINAQSTAEDATTTCTALPSLLGRMSDTMDPSDHMKPTKRGTISADQAASATVAEIMARTRSKMQARRRGERESGVEDEDEEDSSRETIRSRREQLMSRLEEERRRYNIDLQTGDLEVESSPTKVVLSRPEVSLDTQEAKLRAEAHLQIKLAAERRQALDRQSKSPSINTQPAIDSKRISGAVNGQREMDLKACLKRRLLEKK